MSTVLMALLLELSPCFSPMQPEVAQDESLPPGALLRLGTTRFAHLDNITWIGFADGQTLLTTCGDHEMRLWNAATGKESARYPCGSWPRDYFAMSADGKRIVLGAGDGKLRILDITARKEIRTFTTAALIGPREEQSYGHRFILSPDGRLLAIWDRPYLQDTKPKPASLLQIWDIDTGTRLWSWKTGDLFEVEFTPDDKAICAQERDSETQKHCLRSWDTRSGAELRRVELPCALRRFLFLPSGKSLVGLSKKLDALYVLDAATGKEVRRIPAKGGAIHTFALSPDSKHLAVGQEDRLFVQRLDDGSTLLDVPYSLPVLAKMDEVADGILELAAFSPDGKTLAVARGSQCDLWNMTTGKPVHSASALGSPVLAVQTLGNRLLTRDSNFDLTLWDLRTGRFERRFSKTAPQGDKENSGERDRLIGISLRWYGGLQAISPDGTQLAALWPEGPIHLWHLPTGKLLHLLKGSDKATGAVFSPNGKLVAGQVEDSIVLWDTASGKQTQRIKPSNPKDDQGNQPRAMALQFSLDGRTLIASTVVSNDFNGEVLLWELASGTLRRRTSTVQKLGRGSTAGLLDILENVALSYVNSPDGKYIASAGFRTIRWCETDTGKEIYQFGCRNLVGQSCAISPDGKLLAAGLETGSIRFWDLQSGTLLREVPAHAVMVTSLAFGKGRKRLVSSSLDNTVIVWDLQRLLTMPLPTPAAAPAADLKPFWTALGEADGEKAYQVIQTLTAQPNEAVALIKARLQPIPAVDPKRVARLLADLESNQFAVRDQAAREVERLGDLSRPALEKTLTGLPTLETRRRVEAILQKMAPPITQPDQLRAIRAVEVLERIGTADARRVLETLAAGAPGHRLTEDAREALDRLAKR